MTFPTAEENLACDEALLDWAEQELDHGILRVWTPDRYFVVLGYANRLDTEVNTGFCRQNGIPILRRCSGGGTVFHGPGVLNYALILPAAPESPLHGVPAANKFIMEKHRQALAHLLSAPVEICGHTDLAIGSLKFSGNAQRRHKRFILFHGSFLLHFDFDLLENALPMPSAQPDYRLGRPHREFLMNLNIHASLLKNALAQAWKAEAPLGKIPFDRIDTLVRDKYSREDWNAKF